LKLNCQVITLAGVAIKVFTEAMCLGMVLDSTLTFAPHVRRVSGKSFYHLQQLLRPWCTPSSPAGFITATASCMVSAQLTSGHWKKMYGTHFCGASRDLITSVQRRF